MAEQPTSENSTELAPIAKIVKCVSGAFVPGTIALLAYQLTISIATTFASKPIVSDNTAVINISSAGRTLVVGGCGSGVRRLWSSRPGPFLARNSAHTLFSVFSKLRLQTLNNV